MKLSQMSQPESSCCYFMTPLYGASLPHFSHSLSRGPSHLHTRFISARRPGRPLPGWGGRGWLLHPPLGPHPASFGDCVCQREEGSRRCFWDAGSPEEPAKILQEGHLELICPTKALAGFIGSTDCHQAESMGGEERAQNGAVWVEERHAGRPSGQSGVQRMVPGPAKDSERVAQKERAGGRQRVLGPPPPRSLPPHGCHGGDWLPSPPRDIWGCIRHNDLVKKIVMEICNRETLSKASLKPLLRPPAGRRELEIGKRGDNYGAIKVAEMQSNLQV